jgi:hypothetical protein
MSATLSSSSRLAFFTSLEVWYVILQMVSAMALVITIIIGSVLTRRQSKQIVGLEIELSEAKRKQAEAEIALRRVKSLQTPRRLIGSQRERFLLALADKPKGAVDVACVTSPEAFNFAQDLASTLKECGWITGEVEKLIIIGEPIGLGLVVENPDDMPIEIKWLENAIWFAGFPVELIPSKNRAGKPALLIVYDIP